SFLFQAEDGIRDDLVTGVQTCALPISLVQPGSRMAKRGIQALPRAGAEPIQRHREVVHPDPRHDDLLTSCFTATGTGCRIPAPVRSRRSLTRCLDLRWDDDAFCGREPVEIIQASAPARSGLDGVSGLAEELADVA